MTAVRGLHPNMQPLKPKLNPAKAMENATPIDKTTGLGGGVHSATSQYGKKGIIGKGTGINNYSIGANRRYTKGDNISSRYTRYSSFSGNSKIPMIGTPRADFRQAKLAEYAQRFNFVSGNGMNMYANNGMNMFGTSGMNMFSTNGANMFGSNGTNSLLGNMSMLNSASSLGGLVSTVMNAIGGNKSGTPVTNGDRLQAGADALGGGSGNTNISTECKTTLSGLTNANDSTALSTAISSAEQQLNGLGTESEINGEIETCQTNYDNAETAIATNNKTISETGQQITQLGNSITANTNKMASNDRQISTYDGDISRLNAQRNDQNGAEIDKQIEEIKGKQDELRSANEALKKQNDEWQGKIDNELSPKKKEAEGKKEELEKTKDSEKGKLEDAKKKLNDFNELSSGIKKAKEKLAKLEKNESKNLKEVGQDITKIFDANTKLSNKISSDGIVDTNSERKASEQIGKNNIKEKELEKEQKRYQTLSDNTFARHLGDGYQCKANPETGHTIYAHDGKIISQDEYNKNVNA